MSCCDACSEARPQDGSGLVVTQNQKPLDSCSKVRLARTQNMEGAWIRSCEKMAGLPDALDNFAAVHPKASAQGPTLAAVFELYVQLRRSNQAKPAAKNIAQLFRLRKQDRTHPIRVIIDATSTADKVSKLHRLPPSWKWSALSNCPQRRLNRISSSTQPCRIERRFNFGRTAGPIATAMQSMAICCVFDLVVLVDG
jgi:hypothetical protein